MVFVTSGFLCYTNLVYTNMLNHDNTTNAENLRQHKVNFFLSTKALTWIQMLRICLQISKDLDNGVLHYR